MISANLRRDPRRARYDSYFNHLGSEAKLIMAEVLVETAAEANDVLQLKYVLQVVRAPRPGDYMGLVRSLLAVAAASMLASTDRCIMRN